MLLLVIESYLIDYEQNYHLRQGYGLAREQQHESKTANMGLIFPAV